MTNKSKLKLSNILIAISSLLIVLEIIFTSFVICFVIGSLKSKETTVLKDTGFWGFISAIIAFSIVLVFFVYYFLKVHKNIETRAYKLILWQSRYLFSLVIDRTKKYQKFLKQLESENKTEQIYIQERQAEYELKLQKLVKQELEKQKSENAVNETEINNEIDTEQNNK